MKVYITKYNLSVKIETNNSKIVSLIRGFLNRHYTLRNRGFGAQADVTETLFYSKINNYNAWYLHTNQFKHLVHELRLDGIDFSDWEVEDRTNYKVIGTDYEVREGWVLRDEQQPVFDFLVNDPFKTKLIPLVTGSGKTFCALSAIGKLKKRMAVLILPTFISKWASDIVEIHEADTTDIVTIQGSKSIAALVELAKSGEELPYSYFIFSTTTLQNYIKAFEEDPETCVEMYGCEPLEMLPLLGIGVVLLDETHMAFNNIFRIMLHMNVEYQIGLSATLIATDPVTEKSHLAMYPSVVRYRDDLLKKYMDIYPISYNISSSLLPRVRTSMRGSNVYSHIAFEQSLMRDNKLRTEYMILIESVIDGFYIEEYVKGDKLIIFVSTVKMATMLTERLEDSYPDKNVVRYCEQDTYEDMLKGDIIVTTVISAGTGLDIPDLRVGIQTVSIASPVSNIQSAGRLRKLKDRDVKFCYLYCAQISKQVAYHRARLNIFSTRANKILERRSEFNIG